MSFLAPRIYDEDGGIKYDDQVYIIDFLKGETEDMKQYMNLLRPVLANAEIQKVFYGADRDVATFATTYRAPVTNYVDV